MITENSLVPQENLKINPQLIEKDLNPITVFSNLNPWWVTGFSDAESSLSMFISRSKTTIIGWTVIQTFNITLQVREIELLKSIQSFF